MAQGYVYEDSPVGWRPMVNGDLPTSGASAGSYGDGTHVAQVTVNAQGIITAVSNVAITSGSGITSITSSGGTIAITNPSGPTTNLEVNSSSIGSALLSKTVLSGTAGSLTATSLPQTYSALKIICLLQSNHATTDDLVLTFNGDTGLNYDWTGVTSGGNTATGRNAAQIIIGNNLVNGTAVASYYTSIEWTIPQYANTVTSKSINGTVMTPRSTAATFSTAHGGIWHNPTPAGITSLSLTPLTGTLWAIGSTLLVYGMT